MRRQCSRWRPSTARSAPGSPAGRVDDVVGLWEALAKRFAQLGGNSAPMFLRMAGKDTFVPTDSVTRGLVHWQAMPTPPSSRAERRAMQAVFNEWANETGRPLCELSLILALSCD